jgi:NAD(P)-dependent dehydrogenase (short-subunit alcohol dehydrogenase family)
VTLTDKVVLITGGKRIGQVVAKVLASRGAHIAVAYRGSQAEAEKTVTDVTALGRRGVAIAADVSREADCRQLVDATVLALGRLDVLINMASVYRARPFDTMTGDEWDEDLNVNLKSSVICAQAAARHMAADGGRIINFADWLSASSRPGFRDYLSHYVAKAAMKALTEALALELAPGILVNAIAPGPILPSPDQTEQDIKATAEITPLRRWGGEAEVAKVVVMLIETDFMTGETVRVDGGRHLS